MLAQPFPDLALTVELADGRLQKLVVSSHETVWFGRDPECHVVLSSPSISRFHAALELAQEGLLLRDASNNGTLLGERLLRRESAPIGWGDAFMVGSYRIVIGEKRVTEWPDSAARLPQAPQPIITVTDAPAMAEEPPVAPAIPLRAADVPASQRRLIHRRLLDRLDLDRVDRAKLDLVEMRPQVLNALRRITAELAEELPRAGELEQLIKELCDESLGLGPLEDLLSNPDVSEIMVVDPQTIFAEIKGRIQHTPYRFTDAESVRGAIERIVTPLGRRIDESSPLVDARLRDGSRVNAVIPPLAIKGPCITIRKFARERLTMGRLVEFGSLTTRMATFLDRSVRVRKNVVISGGTGSGKTTLLNVMSAAIPDHERVVTIEDAAELQLRQIHVVSLESRPPNMEGKGAYTIRDLVKNALRMRPDRIVVGECRGGEAIDMLQAMNTGHDGSMTTTHANSPKEALSRLETLCLMSGLDLPVRAIRAQIAASVNLIVQQTRFSDGSRRVTSISEVTGLAESGEIECFEIFNFVRERTASDGGVQGEYRLTGYVPSYIDEFISHGLIEKGEDFL